MTGLRCLDRNLRSLYIPNLAHHDDIGILAEKGLESYGKGQSSLVIDIDLIDAGQRYFRRVFRCRDVDPRSIQNVEAGVK